LFSPVHSQFAVVATVTTAVTVTVVVLVAVVDGGDVAPTAWWPFQKATLSHSFTFSLSSFSL